MSYKLKIWHQTAAQLQKECDKIKALIEFSPLRIFEHRKEAIETAKRLQGKAMFDYLEKAQKEENRMRAVWAKRKKIGHEKLTKQLVDIEHELTELKNMIFYEERKYNRQ